MSNASPKPGSPAPIFDLKTPSGVEVKLTACLVEGPVLLEFIRGTWDPDARNRLRELAGARERFAAHKARILVVATEPAESAAHYLENHPSPLTLLVDPDRVVTRLYGILKRFSLPIWNVARPASFLLDRCGFVRHSYVAPLQIHSASLDDILAVLEKI